MIEPLSSETLVINEGCLSVPDLRGDVERQVEVGVRFLDRHGAPQEVVARGLTAGTFPHEVDHLDGVLFLDRVREPTTFSTSAQFERHGKPAFRERVAPLVRDGHALL